MTIGTVGGGNRETRWAGTGTSPEDDIHSSIVPVKVTSATEPAMQLAAGIFVLPGMPKPPELPPDLLPPSSDPLPLPSAPKHLIRWSAVVFTCCEE